MQFMKAAAAAVLVIGATTAGANVTEREALQAEAAWYQLSADQREVIDLVAKDIWQTERESAVPYTEIKGRQKTTLRIEAMQRLGFEPARVSGLEA
jgi:hypothetical protein